MGAVAAPSCLLMQPPMGGCVHCPMGGCISSQPRVWCCHGGKGVGLVHLSLSPLRPNLASLAHLVRRSKGRGGRNSSPDRELFKSCPQALRVCKPPTCPVCHRLPNQLVPKPRGAGTQSCAQSSCKPGKPWLQPFCLYPSLPPSLHAWRWRWPAGGQQGAGALLQDAARRRGRRGGGRAARARRAGRGPGRGGGGGWMKGGG